MKTTIDQTQEEQNTAAPKVQQEPSTGGTATIVDNRPATVYQRKLRATMDASAKSKTWPIQRKESKSSPRGSSRFQKIATSMGDQYGVDTSSLSATHNSSFPGTLHAEATIQGSNIHFAPGRDTNYNIRHEVAHAIDNTINGTPRGDQQVNGQRIDTTREKTVDRMAKKSITQRKGKENVNDDNGLGRKVNLISEKPVKGGNREKGVHQASGLSYTQKTLESGVIQRFVSDGGHYEIKNGNKERLYNHSGTAPTPQPERLYESLPDGQETYWKSRVKFVTHVWNAKNVNSMNRVRTTFVREMRQMIGNLNAGEIYVAGKNDCIAFARILKFLIESYQSDESNDEASGERATHDSSSLLSTEEDPAGFGWDDVSIGTTIHTQFNPKRRLRGDVRDNFGHAITIVAEDGTSKIALQANAGANMTEPEFIGLNSYKDWFDLLVHTPKRSMLNSPVTKFKAILASISKKKAVNIQEQEAVNIQDKANIKHRGKRGDSAGPLGQEKEKGRRLLDITDNHQFFIAVFANQKYIIEEKD